eukprot:995852-Lingulodinium_polyedra.AAC.1
MFPPARRGRRTDSGNVHRETNITPSESASNAGWMSMVGSFKVSRVYSPGNGTDSPRSCIGRCQQDLAGVFDWPRDPTGFGEVQDFAWRPGRRTTGQDRSCHGCRGLAFSTFESREPHQIGQCLENSGEGELAGAFLP